MNSDAAKAYRRQGKDNNIDQKILTISDECQFIPGGQTYTKPDMIDRATSPIIWDDDDEYYENIHNNKSKKSVNKRFSKNRKSISPKNSRKSRISKTKDKMFNKDGKSNSNSPKSPNKNYQNNLNNLINNELDELLPKENKSKDNNIDENDYLDSTDPKELYKGIVVDGKNLDSLSPPEILYVYKLIYIVLKIN